MTYNTKISHVLIANSFNYYEFMVPNDGYIGILLEHCTGNMDMSYS